MISALTFDIQEHAEHCLREAKLAMGKCIVDSGIEVIGADYPRYKVWVMPIENDFGHTAAISCWLRGFQCGYQTRIRRTNHKPPILGRIWS